LIVIEVTPAMLKAVALKVAPPSVLLKIPVLKPAAYIVAGLVDGSSAIEVSPSDPLLLLHPVCAG
jgi:hypothetical protein